MKLTKIVPALCVITLARAQDNFLSSILSDAQSIYTAVTSILAPTTAATTTSSSSSTASSTSSSSSTSASSSSESSSSNSSSITAAPTSSPSITGTPTSVAAAAATSTNTNGTANGSNGGGSNLLAIVLGCTLGALALAAFLALLWLCLRRRKRNKNYSSKHRAGSPDYDEIESWRHAKPYVRSEKGVQNTITPLSQRSLTAPLMSERSPTHMHSQHQNPFVPVPPPARKSSRHGLNDETEYSAHPYSPDHYPNHYPESAKAPHSGHGEHALEAGLSGAALGGLAAHARDRHERKRSESRGRSTHEKVPFSEAEHNALPEATLDGRRSGDVARANAKEPWPFMADNKRSMDSSRSRSRSFGRGDDHFVTPNQTPSEPMPSRTGAASAAAIGGIAGAAAQKRATAHSPHRKGILKNTNSHFSTSSSSSGDQRQSRSPVSDITHDQNATGPHELESAHVPLPPMQRERRDSTLGTAAPLAAAAAYMNHRRSGSRGSGTSPSRLSLAVPDNEHEPPILPARSPNRNSLDSRARYSSANAGTAELPSSTTRHPTEMPLSDDKKEAISPTLEPQTFTENNGVMSPVSPVTENGSWSRAQAEQLGISPTGIDAKTASQESTAVGSPPGEKHIDDNSDNSSSGLVSAIQKIFSSQKSAWDQDDDVEIVPALSRKHDSRNVEHDRPYRSVPRRKAAPARNSAQLHSQYGELAQTDIDEPQTQPFSTQRESNRPSHDSARSLPPQYQATDTSLTATSMHDFASTTSSTTTPARPRAHSRPGYGIGSGDPFDLARTRTDSSMTGISLANYTEPLPPSRPSPYRSSTGSSYKEPTLADLRREVMAEDRERAKQAWRKSQSRERTNSVGRYGDDKEFFDLVDETTGSGRFYADNGHGRRKSGPGEVGWAY